MQKVKHSKFIGTHAFLIFIGFLFVLPLIYMIVNAFKPYDEFFLWPPRFWVRRPTLEHFLSLFMATSGSSVPFSRYIFNSVMVTAVTVSLVLVIQSMAAYPLAKHTFPGKNVINYMNMAAFMFAPMVIAIPRFLVVNYLGMLNTYWALIIPLLAQPFMVFLLKQYMGEVPDALIESAKMDGANQWTVYYKIIMPVVKPAIATVLIFTFIAVWRDSTSAIIYIRDESLKTIPVVLSTIAGGGMSIGRLGATAAAGFLMTVPTVAIFVLLQRNVMSTMAHSGIKG